MKIILPDLDGYATKTGGVLRVTHNNALGSTNGATFSKTAAGSS